MLQLQFSFFNYKFLHQLENEAFTSVSKGLVAAIKDAARMRLQPLRDNVHKLICAVPKSPEKNFCDHV